MYHQGDSYKNCREKWLKLLNPNNPLADIADSEMSCGYFRRFYQFDNFLAEYVIKLFYLHVFD